ncbi:MAG: aminodeoxychorismate synthase component I [Bacteroidales bacterium]|nr:aminodeoxychorismate synthase component I [Bacteroidales bacterium]
MNASKDIINRMNELGKNSSPFLFIIDFNVDKPLLFAPEELENNNIWVQMPDFSSVPEFKTETGSQVHFDIFPEEFKKYQQAFHLVMDHINRGDTYLVNLTAQTPVECNLTLREIFTRSKAPYKLIFGDEFLVFSPERFVKIQGNTISSYPMKGTIRAHNPGAGKELLNDEKELAEHNTIVDLIRSDLNRVSKKVRVKRFRYLEQIETIKGPILQTSSEITGELDHNWRNNIGSILFELLPAGSISGAPKQKTVEIIQNVEGFNRGWFTGVFGYFDGINLDSAVMIRFIENNDGRLCFKSGGGITSFSECEKEYRELIDKVYVPIV